MKIKKKMIKVIEQFRKDISLGRTFEETELYQLIEDSEEKLWLIIEIIFFGINLPIRINLIFRNIKQVPGLSLMTISWQFVSLMPKQS